MHEKKHEKQFNTLETIIEAEINNNFGKALSGAATCRLFDAKSYVTCCTL